MYRTGTFDVPRSSRPIELSPAGARIPVQYKKSLAEKIPLMVDRLKEEGANEDQIKQAIFAKKIKSIEKYGNRSKVGMLMNEQNKHLLG